MIPSLPPSTWLRATPVLNAMSLFLMVASALLALTLLRVNKTSDAREQLERRGCPSFFPWFWITWRDQ